jgi:pimeloyl-ACP methyl ester carboxylesterase
MQFKFRTAKTFLSVVTLSALFVSYAVEATQKKDVPSVKPVASGYSDVNGIKLYREIYGKGDPVILLHGGFMTIPEMMPLITPLATERSVIAVELQGHGRTADTDRPLTLETLGDDIAALIVDLGIKKPDIIGYSFGADVALRTAIQRPDLVRRLVVISTPYSRSGWYPEGLKAMSQVNSKMAEQFLKTPTGKMSQKWPKPELFPQFLDKMGAMMAKDYDWSAEIKRFKMPVMLMFADHDAVSTRHIAEFYALLGGGLKDAGWQNTEFTNARLAIIPGYSHYNFTTAPELGPIIKKFLADPMTKTKGDDAVAASKVSN